MARIDTANASSRPGIDWEAVEIAYRAGIRSLKDIGNEFGVSDAGILKRAKRDGWVRDLKAKIRAKADAKVSAAMVSGEVSSRTKAAEAQVIEVESTVQARIRLTHRKDVARGRALAMKLLQELEHQTDCGDLYDQLVNLVVPAGDDTDRGGERARKLREAYDRALSLSGRTKTMKDLADTLRTLVGLEREAYGINDDGGSDEQKSARESLRDFFSSLHQSGRGRIQIASSAMEATGASARDDDGPG